MPVQIEPTPMLRHYLELKAQYPDAVLFYRMGDFFELFFDDARRVAPLLDLTLTARQKGTENEAPMCGVPHHALEGYVGRLIQLGLKVAICDQVEDPRQAKGLVRREITRVVTPGTLSEPGLLEGKRENLLASLEWRGAAGAGAFLDVSTGDFFLRRWRSAFEAIADLESWRPREALLPPAGLPAELEAWLARAIACRTTLEEERRPGPAAAAAALARQFGVATLRGLGLDEREPGIVAAAAALAYAQESQRSGLGHVTNLELREASDRLVLDGTTLANLEIFESQADGGRSGSLLEAIDATSTAAGGRALREWLRRPLQDVEAIAARQRGVGELADDPRRRDRVRAALARLPDLERLAARAVLGALAPREAAALRDGLAALPALQADLAGASSEPLRAAAAAEPVADLAAELARRLEPSPAASLEDGGVIAAGVDPELDRFRSLTGDSKRHILAIESRERERTGIASLKIRYNRVFGYSIEITRANQALVPPDYIRRQTLANAERYVTPEIKDLEEQILHAEERQLALERQHFELLRATIAAAAPRLRALAGVLAALDVVAGWAEIAARRGWNRPEVVEEPGIAIVEGRHPVVERALGDGFVPNDAELDPETAQIVVLTGPNMGGKSTYLRQVALLVVLAQAGCRVPAKSARIGRVDRVFSRVGASDNLARGESTFMVEMIETANILRFATARSLVILDEVGRGTATFDGLSLAWAIVEHLHERPRPLTLFATHYHELTELAALLPRVVNRTMAVREWEDRIVFLRRVVPGAADKSYGLHVARLAGIPQEVIERAGKILANLEAKEYDAAGKPRLAEGAELAATATAASQLPLFTPAQEIVAQLLREVDVDRLTPLAALNLIASLRDRLG